MKQICSILVFLCLSSIAWADYITIANKEGQTIEVELLESAEKEVKFKDRNGKKYTVKLNTMSLESQKVIEAWAKEANKIALLPEDRIKIYVHTGRNTEHTDYAYIALKDSNERIEPKIIIENDELLRGFKDLKATLVLIGEDVTDRNKLKVVFKDSFTFSLPAKQKFEWSGKPFALDYRTDNETGYNLSYGFRYRYFFVVIENPDGSIGHAAGSLSKWTRQPRLIDALELEAIYNRDLL